VTVWTVTITRKMASGVRGPASASLVAPNAGISSQPDLYRTRVRKITDTLTRAMPCPIQVPLFLGCV